MLSSDQCSEYRKKENAHVHEYLHKKKAAQAAAASGQPPPPPPIPCADDDTANSQDKAKKIKSIVVCKIHKIVRNVTE